MTRFVDSGAVIRLASDEVEVAAGHKLPAPTLMRRAGEIADQPT